MLTINEDLKYFANDGLIDLEAQCQKLNKDTVKFIQKIYSKADKITESSEEFYSSQDGTLKENWKEQNRLAKKAEMAIWLWLSPMFPGLSMPDFTVYRSGKQKSIHAAIADLSTEYFHFHIKCSSLKTFHFRHGEHVWTFKNNEPHLKQPGEHIVILMEECSETKFQIRFWLSVPQAKKYMCFAKEGNAGSITRKFIYSQDLMEVVNPLLTAQLKLT